MSTVWRTLKVSAEELRLDTTLKCGQSFRWKVSGKNEWYRIISYKYILKFYYNNIY
jgi:hypothetical protein